MKNYSPYQFSYFRILLGAYLLVHFSMLLPFSAEMWSNTGILPDAAVNLTHGIFPNILNLIDSPVFVQIFLCLLIVASVLFTTGVARQYTALVLWYGWVCLFDRNNLIANPGLPFVGWILLCCVFIPKGEPLCLFSSKKEDWKFPPLLFWGGWVLMSVAYTLSGIDKLHSPSWADGSAIEHLLNNPLARDWFLRDLFLSLPAWAIKGMTWSILAIEILFLPLASWDKSRKWIWLLMIGMHLGILLIVDFADLTLGMLMIHWFTFDGSWLKPDRSAAQNNIVFFDGVCGLCNSFVDFLMKEDRYEILRFAPLQGETAKGYLPGNDPENLKTVIFHSNGKTYTKSDAVIEIHRSIGNLWKLTVVFYAIPKGLRDTVYNYVATNRYKWFGQKETCRMPTEKERGKLLK